MGGFLCPRDDVKAGKIADPWLEIVRCGIRFGSIQGTFPPPSAADYKVVVFRSRGAQCDVCIATRQVGQVVSGNNFQQDTRIAPTKLAEVRSYHIGG